MVGLTSQRRFLDPMTWQERDIEHLEDEAERLAEEVRDLHTEVATQERKKNQLRKKLAKAKVAIDNLEEEVGELTQAILEHSDQVRRLEREATGHMMAARREQQEWRIERFYWLAAGFFIPIFMEVLGIRWW